MSREFKFRVWSEVDGCHYDLQWIDFELSFASIVLQRNEFGTPTVTETRPLKQLSLMQYTGLKDKNGVEIYEGDIVYNTLEPRGTNYEVKFFDRFAMFGLSINGVFYGEINLRDGTPRPVEVIGNIYENPELLERA